jgi:hypothetical protein
LYRKYLPFTAEVHHFHHSSPDEKLRRDIGEKCHCVLKKEYKMTETRFFEEEGSLPSKVPYFKLTRRRAFTALLFWSWSIDWHLGKP